MAGGGGSQVHNNATAWPNLGLLDSNKFDSKLGPSVAKIIGKTEQMSDMFF